MTRCSAWNIRTLIVVQFLSFPIITTKKSFGQILKTFPSLGIIRAGKIENRV